MLNLISIAQFFVTQVFPALFGLLFVRQFKRRRLIAGPYRRGGARAAFLTGETSRALQYRPDSAAPEFLVASR
jgi:hypothetical protein